MMAVASGIVRQVVLKRLWELRLKPTDLASIIGIDVETLGRLESDSGDIGFEALLSIAECLHVPEATVELALDARVANQYQSVWIARKLSLQCRRSIKERRTLQAERQAAVSARRILLKEKQQMIKDSRDSWA